MRNEPDLVNTYRVLWGLSLLVLVLPGPDAHAGVLFTVILATVWGARTGAWVHEDREAGLLDRVQVLTAGPAGSRTRRLLAGFGAALLGGLAMGLPHGLLGGLVLLPPGSNAAALTIPLGGLAALAGYGLGTGLHPAMGDGTTAAVAIVAPGAAAGYWFLQPTVLLGVPPTMLAFSVIPPRGLEPWSWGVALPAASVLVALLVGWAVAVRSPRPLGVDPRWSLLLAPLLLVGLLAGSPGSTTDPASDERSRPDGAAVLLDGREEIVSSLDAAEPNGTPPDQSRLDPSEIPVRGQRDVLVYLNPAPDPTPSTLRWPGGEAVLEERVGTWRFDGPYQRTHEVSIWTATATVDRAPEFVDNGFEPRQLEEPADYGVYVKTSLPFHPAWAVAAGLPGLALAAPATRWWGVRDA